MKINKFIKALLLTLTISTAGFAFAEDVTIKSSAMVEKIQKDASGKEIKKVEPAVSVVPGQEVLFKNEIDNQGKNPAKDIVVTNPIPEHMIFNSAYGPADTTLTYSIDGKIFASADKLMTKDTTTGNNRVARPEEYRFVRWTLVRPLAVSSKTDIGYRATLK